MSVWTSKHDVYDVLANLAPMRRYARALTRDEIAAEDLVHDALVRAYEKRSTFRLGCDLRTWILSILHNTFIDSQRRLKAEQRRVSQSADLYETHFPASQENAIRLQQVRQAFLRLPDEQRSVLHLVAIEGMKYQEAADTLGISIGTLMSRLGRARAALRLFEEGGAAKQTEAGHSAVRKYGHPKLKVVGGRNE
jgi:RNA polymerase sigma-70 factor (ECF subfamily)